MTLPDEIISAVGPIVESVAADISRRYRQFGLGQDDASQENWVWVYDHPHKVMDWFDPDITSPKAGEKMLARTLRNHLSDYGEDLKAQHLGYSREDLVYYSKASLKELLPSMFDREAWIYPERNDGERVRGGDPATGGNWIATLADISRAFDRLDDGDRDLLRMFHEAPVWRNKDAANYFGITEQVMSYRHDAAVGRLLKLLGGPKPKAQHFDDCDHDYVGTRRSVSNAAARSIQESYWEES